MNFKASVTNTNMIRKINNAYEDVKEEKNLSKEILNIIRLLEEELKHIDFLLLLYFAFICFVEKPEWCIHKKEFMSSNCEEDLYGNNYNIFFFFSLNDKMIFPGACFVMFYFTVKYLICFSFI